MYASVPRRVTDGEGAYMSFWRETSLPGHQSASSPSFIIQQLTEFSLLAPWLLNRRVNMEITPSAYHPLLSLTGDRTAVGEVSVEVASFSEGAGHERCRCRRVDKVEEPVSELVVWQPGPGPVAPSHEAVAFLTKRQWVTE